VLLLGFSLALWICGLTVPRSAAAAEPAGVSSPNLQSSSPVVFIDPDILDSEWNHHVAGYILIGISLLVLAAYRFPELASAHRLWPGLFLGAALFLAVWSDKEIWPRGALAWTWLIHHDAEARQHKLFAILLFAMGIIEYLRSSGRLPQFWKTWAFPVLAVLGAGILLMHDHGGNSGLPAGWDNSEKLAKIAKITGTSPEALQQAYLTNRASPSGGDMPAMSGHGDMEGMDHEMSPVGSSRSAAQGSHVMTASMLRVQEQHLWFTLVGLAIAFLKFVHDRGFWRRSFVPYLWPMATCLLGILLALYAEAG